MVPPNVWTFHLNLLTKPKIALSEMERGKRVLEGKVCAGQGEGVGGRLKGNPLYIRVKTLDKKGWLMIWAELGTGNGRELRFWSGRLDDREICRLCRSGRGEG